MRNAALGTLFVVMIVGRIAIGGPSLEPSTKGDKGKDVADTHARLERIFARLGIEQTEDEAQGCACAPQAKPEQNKGSSTPRPMPGWLGYLLLAIVLVAMLVPLGLALRGSYREVSGPAEALAEPDGEDSAGAGRPGPWTVDLSRCHELIAAGRVAEAFAALHRLTLLSLERAGHLVLDPTTTNWSYVRALAGQPQLGRVLASVTEAAERSVLGERPPTVEQFFELEQLIAQQVQT